MIRSLMRTPLTHFGMLAKGKPSDPDLVGEERKSWEREQLASVVHFDGLGVDSAPFQLVESSSLYKVHALFSLLGLNRAYGACLLLCAGE